MINKIINFLKDLDPVLLLIIAIAIKYIGIYTSFIITVFPIVLSLALLIGVKIYEYTVKLTKWSYKTFKSLLKRKPKEEYKPKDYLESLSKKFN